MLLPLRMLWGGEGSPQPEETQVKGAAVLPRWVVLERMEEEAMIATLLSEE